MCDGPDTGYQSWYEPVEEIYWEHEMIEHPDEPEDRDDYLPED